jgi:hypothetical protein
MGYRSSPARLLRELWSAGNRFAGVKWSVLRRRPCRSVRKVIAVARPLRLAALGGTLALALAGGLPTAAPATAGVDGAAMVRPAAACPSTPVYSDSATVNVDNGYAELASRTGACQAANIVGYHEITSWPVKDATHGQMLCNTTFNMKTNVWYQEKNPPYDWSWAGGTSKPAWMGSC